MQTFLFRHMRVKYIEAGRGPALLMLHNGGSDHRIWDAQVPFFSQQYRVLALDLPGFGESDKPDIPYTLDLYADLLEDLLRENRIERPVLMGNCIGAAAALAAGLRRPESVAGLVLFNVCGGRTMLRRTTGFAFRPYPGMRRAYLAFFRLVNAVPRLHRRVLNRLFGSPPAETDPLFRQLRDLQRRPWHPDSRWNLMRGLDSFDKFSGAFTRPENLPPTYLLWGARNRVLSLECGMALSRTLAPHRVTPIPDAGHMAMHEQPERVNGLVQAFLRDFRLSRHSPGKIRDEQEPSPRCEAPRLVPG